VQSVLFIECDDAYTGSVDRRKPWSAHNRGRNSARHSSRRNFDISEDTQMGIDKADTVPGVRVVQWKMKNKKKVLA
jgi:hypothetical protein